MAFQLHPRLAADTIPLGKFSLSRLLLMNDSRYPWCILVPERENIREIHALSENDQRPRDLPYDSRTPRFRPA